jgi:uncharacterized ferritin-like protein (DUF455 family)
MSATAMETKVVCGVTLRKDPAREACFNVVDTDAEMAAWADFSAESMRERLHRHMNNEITSLEIAAQCLADFPDAPWELRMQLARQAWDESRHIDSLHRRLKEIGGFKGEFPVANFEWTVTCSLDSLVGRLAIQNRTFEAGTMDLMATLPGKWRQAGDAKTADLLDAIAADEIQHVRFANQWIRRLVSEDKRQLFKVAHAVRFLAEVNDAFAQVADGLNASGQPMIDHVGKVAPINVADRIEADFSEAEVAEILRQSGFPALVPEREAAT